MLMQVFMCTSFTRVNIEFTLMENFNTIVLYIPSRIELLEEATWGLYGTVYVRFKPLNM